MSDVKKRRFKCNGCGESRPCYVETNQEPSSMSLPVEDLRCVLDETNQTGFHWIEVEAKRSK